MNKTLGLVQKFTPTTSIRHVFGNLKLEEIVSCLRSLTEEDAQMICALYDRLPKPHQKICNIDYLIAAANCRDPHGVAGMITTAYSRIKALETQVVAAEASPGIMADVSRRAKTSRGFHHAKLALQITGVAPVPKNNFSVTNIRGNVDQSKNVLISVPAHHEAVNEVSDILGKLPQVIDVQPDKNSG